MSHPRHPQGALCQTCGRWFSWFEFAETIEELLCEECASGIGDDDLEDNYYDSEFE